MKVRRALVLVLATIGIWFWIAPAASAGTCVDVQDTPPPWDFTVCTP